MMKVSICWDIYPLSHVRQPQEKQIAFRLDFSQGKRYVKGDVKEANREGEMFVCNAASGQDASS